MKSFLTNREDLKFCPYMLNFIGSQCKDAGTGEVCCLLPGPGSSV